MDFNQDGAWPQRREFFLDRAYTAITAKGGDSALVGQRHIGDSPRAVCRETVSILGAVRKPLSGPQGARRLCSEKRRRTQESGLLEFGTGVI